MENFVRLPADSGGKRLRTVENVINGVEVHQQVMTIADANTPENTQRVDAYGSAFIRYANGGMDFDSFGNTKVSQIRPLGVYMHTTGKLDHLFTENITGTASSTYLPLEKGVRLTVATGGTDKIQRITDKSHVYTAGISNTILITCAMGDLGKAGVVRRWGYGNNNDGLFFELDGTTFSIVQRSSVSGTVVETRVTQNEFNSDKVDGTGTSGFNLILDKANIYWIDFQWLGVGITRFGVYSSLGNKLTLHEFTNANAYSTIYMSSGSLPILFEQYNKAITSSSSEMKIFNSVVMQNNVNHKPLSYYQSTGLINKSISASSAVHVVSLRPKLQDNGLINKTNMMLKRIEMHTTQPVFVMVSKNAVLTGATWTDVQSNNYPKSQITTNASINYSTEGNKGRVLITKIVNGTESIDLTEVFECGKECLSLDANGAQTHAITIAVMPVSYSTTFNVFADVAWNEVHL
jgi:hypothetical protein